MINRNISSIGYGEAFGSRDTHQIAIMPNHEMIASSEGLGWQNLYVVLQREAAYSSYLNPVNDHLFVFHLRGSVGIHWSTSDQDVAGRVTPGHFDFVPGREGLDVHLGGSIETMHLYLRRSIVDAVIEDMLGEDPSQIKLRPVFNGSDALLEQVGVCIRNALHDNSRANTLYVEQLSWTLAAHLVRNHCRKASSAPPIGGLSQQQLRRVIDFIEAHMEKPLDLRNLSAAACLNSVYFGRQFKRTTNMSPHQFVIQRRLERAKTLLATTSQPIAEIAAGCGFCHQEHLTRLFRSRCGITPSAYRKSFSV
jgi:AraC family transcriptional regulator